MYIIISENVFDLLIKLKHTHKQTQFDEYFQETK